MAGRFVRMRGGPEHSFYYMPFNAEAFGETVSYFEEKKKGRIMEIEEVESEDTEIKNSP